MRRKRTDFIVVHCSATKPAMDIGRAEIDAWHKQNGWDGIGYHFVVRRSGDIEVGRHHAEIGIHAKGFNSRSVAVCLVGGLDERGAVQANYTDAQWMALRGIILALKQTYLDAEVLGHRDFPNVTKSCPCFDVRAWWRENAPEEAQDQQAGEGRTDSTP